VPALTAAAAVLIRPNAQKGPCPHASTRKAAPPRVERGMEVEVEVEVEVGFPRVVTGTGCRLRAL